MSVRSLCACLLVVAIRIQAGEVSPAKPTWRGTWENRFGETRAEWVLELADGPGEVSGTLRSGETSWEVAGRREGPWLELTWKAADGRVTQARGVVGDGQWRGLTLSGGDGHWVEYGRFTLRVEAPPPGPMAPNPG